MGILLLLLFIFVIVRIFTSVISSSDNNTSKNNIENSTNINKDANHQILNKQPIVTTPSINKYQQVTNNKPNIQRLSELQNKKETPTLIESFGRYYNAIINNNNINFSYIRQYAVDIVGKNSSLLSHHGVLPLVNETELYQYIYSYGNMHYAKIKSALNCLPTSLFGENIEVIDWGCGQGIATITLLELKRTNNVRFTLIEPGLLALKRAALHVKYFHRKYAKGEFSCKTINKSFDDLRSSDVYTSQNRIKIHLFSNTLDIMGRYSQNDLIDLIKRTQKGKNYFICCSPYQDLQRKYKIDNFVNAFKYKSEFKLYASIDNSKDDDMWNCSYQFRGATCNSNCDDCNKKWTRIIRVFSVNI